ncbi:MAG: haloacid dehalogenase type II [Bacteroidota bacterium]
MKHHKAYLFDAFGTLFQLEMPEHLLERIEKEQASLLMDIWRKLQLEYTWLHNSMQTYVPFGEISKQALDYAMQVANVKDLELREQLLTIYFRATTFPDVPDMLARMRENDIQLAILSNGAPQMLEAGAKHSGIYDVLDHLLSVDAIKVYKPDPRVYQMALDKFGLEKQDVRFFSSNQWDVAGASQFGLDTTWVNRKQGIQEPLIRHPITTIHSFDEL